MKQNNIIVRIIFFSSLLKAKHRIFKTKNFFHTTFFEQIFKSHFSKSNDSGTDPPNQLNQELNKSSLEPSSNEVVLFFRSDFFLFLCFIFLSFTLKIQHTFLPIEIGLQNLSPLSIFTFFFHESKEPLKMNWNKKRKLYRHPWTRSPGAPSGTPQ